VLLATPGVDSARRADGADGGDDDDDEAAAPTRLVTLLARPPTAQATLLAVAFFLPVGFYETIWAKHSTNLGGSSTVIALSVALYGLPYMLVAPIGGRLGDRIGSARLAQRGTIGLVAITAVTGIPRGYWILIGLGVIEAVISAVAYPNAQAAMSRACAPSEKATGQGLAGAASIAGAGAMVLLAGLLFEFGGATVAFAATAALVGLGAGAAAVIGGRVGRPEPIGPPISDRG